MGKIDVIRLTDNVRRFEPWREKPSKPRLFFVRDLGNRLQMLRSTWGANRPFPKERPVGTASCFGQLLVLGSFVVVGHLLDYWDFFLLF